MKDIYKKSITKQDIKTGDYIYFYGHNDFFGGNDRNMTKGIFCKIEKINKTYITIRGIDKNISYQLNPETSRIKGYKFISYVIYIKSNDISEYRENINNNRKLEYLEFIGLDIKKTLDKYKNINDEDIVNILSKIIKEKI